MKNRNLVPHATDSRNPETASAPAVAERSEKPKKREIAAYALSTAGQNILFGLLSSALVYYYQSVIFLPALAVGVLNAAAQAFNVVKDPLMGIILDKTRTNIGKCRPYLIAMPILIGIATAAVFFNDIYSKSNAASKNAAILAAAACTNLLWNLLYTAGDVPLTAFPSVVTTDSNQKSKLIAYATIAATLGAGAVSLFFLPFAQSLSVLFPSVKPEKASQYGFLVAVLIFSGIGTALYQLVGFFGKERVKSAAPKKKQSVRASFKTMRSIRPYRRIFIAGLLRSPADTVMTTLTMIIVYYFGNNGNTPYLVYTAAFLLSLGIGQIVSTLFSPAVSRRIERKTAFLIATAGLTASTTAIFVLYLAMPNTLNAAGAVASLSALLFLLGLASGLLNVTQSNMVADAVDYAEYHTGKRPDGVFFSGLTMLNKISVGVTALVTGAVFAAVGFSGGGVEAVNDALNSGAVFRADEAFANYRFAMFFLMCVPPVVGFLLSSIPMFRYELSNREHAEIVRRLEERRAAESRGDSVRNETTAASEDTDSSENGSKR